MGRSHLERLRKSVRQRRHEVIAHPSLKHERKEQKKLVGLNIQAGVSRSKHLDCCPDHLDPSKCVWLSSIEQSDELNSVEVDQQMASARNSFLKYAERTCAVTHGKEKHGPIIVAVANLIGLFPDLRVCLKSAYETGSDLCTTASNVSDLYSRLAINSKNLYSGAFIAEVKKERNAQDAHRRKMCAIVHKLQKWCEDVDSQMRELADLRIDEGRAIRIAKSESGRARVVADIMCCTSASGLALGGTIGTLFSMFGTTPAIVSTCAGVLGAGAAGLLAHRAQSSQAEANAKRSFAAKEVPEITTPMHRLRQAMDILIWKLDILHNSVRHRILQDPTGHGRYDLMRDRWDKTAKMWNEVLNQLYKAIEIKDDPEAKVNVSDSEEEMPLRN